MVKGYDLNAPVRLSYGFGLVGSNPARDDFSFAFSMSFCRNCDCGDGKELKVIFLGGNRVAGRVR